MKREASELKALWNVGQMQRKTWLNLFKNITCIMIVTLDTIIMQVTFKIVKGRNAQKSVFSHETEPNDKSEGD